eukprot:gene6974-9402_t
MRRMAMASATVFATGKSILDRSSRTNVGELMLAYGGGGHQAAGTCQVDNDRAAAVLNELIVPAPSDNRAGVRRGDRRHAGAVAWGIHLRGVPMLRRLSLAVLALTATLALSGCGYNQFQKLDEEVKASWAEVLNQYQRRADLIPNIVATVKGEASFEQDTLTKVIEARSRATTSSKSASLAISARNGASARVRSNSIQRASEAPFASPSASSTATSAVSQFSGGGGGGSGSRRPQREASFTLGRD